ncbi:LytR C-terminal domain-containing protein [Dietzia aerolata]|uniref:LytR C-terminal domain-containing protein n=1 Tax=Dietzia aerolata TaxID=595984 RepID=A0ABV5JNH1_9ACTN
MSTQYENPQYNGEYDDADPDAHGEPPHADEPSGPPYRAIAMVLLSAVVLAIGVGLVQLFGGEDEGATAVEESTSQVEQGGDGQGAPGADGAGQGGQGQDGSAPADGGQPLPPPPGADQDPDAASAPGADGQAGGQSAGQAQAAGGGNSGVTSVPVQIYNNSTVVGLAGRTGEQLRESGFAVGDVANLPSNRGVVAESTAFYGNGLGEQEAAQAVAQQLGIVAKPRPADMAADGPGVIVIVTQDLQG